MNLTLISLGPVEELKDWDVQSWKITQNRVRFLLMHFDWSSPRWIGQNSIFSSQFFLLHSSLFSSLASNSEEKFNFQTYIIEQVSYRGVLSSKYNRSYRKIKSTSQFWEHFKKWPWIWHPSHLVQFKNLRIGLSRVGKSLKTESEHYSSFCSRILVWILLSGSNRILFLLSGALFSSFSSKNEEKLNFQI